MNLALMLAGSLAVSVVISDARKSRTKDQRNPRKLPRPSTSSQKRKTLEQKTCRIVSNGGSILLDKQDNCQDCEKCIVSPYKKLINGTLATPYFCRQHEPFGKLIKLSCLVKNVTDDTTIRQGRCRLSDECSQGPVGLTLCDGTDAELFFCQSTQIESDEEDSPENDKRNIFTALMKHGCSVTHVAKKTELSREVSCDNCTKGPVSITTDGVGEFQLYFCNDEQNRHTPRRPPTQGKRGHRGGDVTDKSRGGQGGRGDRRREGGRGDGEGQPGSRRPGGGRGDGEGQPGSRRPGGGRGDGEGQPGSRPPGGGRGDDEGQPGSRPLGGGRGDDEGQPGSRPPGGGRGRGSRLPGYNK